MTLKEPTRVPFKLIDKAVNRPTNESDQFRAGQMVATTLSPGIYKVGVFLSYKPQNLPTDPVEYTYIGEVVTFSMSGPSKSRLEFEKWKINTIRLATKKETDNHKKVYPTSL